jgi:polysaccharide deacetylase family protein (PEP-CTERM system associated)
VSDGPDRRPEHFFTVDVEEYFQVSAFEAHVERESWERLPSRVERNVDVLLELLARYGARGTFFTVGWIAKRHPWMVRRIVAAGHEIASHSFWHRRVNALAPAEFRDDVRQAREVIEDISGQRVYGFRAPSFSIRTGMDWVFDILLEEGHRYDSSTFPIRRPGYGNPGAPTTPYLIRRPGGDLLELPLATTSLLGMRLPAAGGAYLRQLPLALVHRGLREHERQRRGAMFYVHPWEIDPEQPRIDVGLITAVRHYRGLDRTLPRLERLLGEFRFTSVAAHFGLLGADQWDPSKAALPA